MILNFDHIAILTNDLKALSAQLPSWLTGYELEKHPAEGTLEQYVSPPSDDDPSILLLEAIQDGPYRDAYKKRGPGLHHVACATDSLDDAVQHFASHGLLLHPISLKTYANRVVWLCRPGLPFLVELFQNKKIKLLNQQKTVLKLPQKQQLGVYNPVEFIPNASITNGDSEAVFIQIGENSCTINPIQ